MNPTPLESHRERRENIAAIPLDEEFRESIQDAETFRARLETHKHIRRLETVDHQISGQTVLEHTRSVLRHLRTDALRHIKLDGTSFQTPELMRMVALYHDVDKGLRKKPGTPIHKSQAIDAAVEELRRVKPGFLQTPKDEKVFRVLIATCDYFGYNLNILSNQGTAFRIEIKTLLERHLERPLETLTDEGIDLAHEDVLRIQYEISRADTLGIEPFRKNVGQVDRLFEELNKAFAY